MKMIKKTQTGVGLVEVMIALLLLGVAVLGFIALQVRAISASEEAGQNVQAMNLARDLSERMRKLTKITKHAKRHFWLNDVCTCHGLLPSHSA